MLSASSLFVLPRLHSLTCGVPDRESNEIKNLREATELIETWQHQLLSGLPMSGPPSEHSEVILVERQRQDTVRALLSHLSVCRVLLGLIAVVLEFVHDNQREGTSISLVNL